MSRFIVFALQLCDPRGRCDRRGLLIGAGVLLGAQIAVAAMLWAIAGSLDGMPAAAASLAFCWLGAAILSKRLHDLGRSAWWLPAAALGWFAGAWGLALATAILAGPGALAPGTPGYWTILASMLAPLAVGVLWLHMAEGDATANRFGPPPVTGFSMPHSDRYGPRDISIRV